MGKNRGRRGGGGGGGQQPQNPPNPNQQQNPQGQPAQSPVNPQRDQGQQPHNPTQQPRGFPQPQEGPQGFQRGSDHHNRGGGGRGNWRGHGQPNPNAPFQENRRQDYQQNRPETGQQFEHRQQNQSGFEERGRGGGQGWEGRGRGRGDRGGGQGRGDRGRGTRGRGRGEGGGRGRGQPGLSYQEPQGAVGGSNFPQKDFSDSSSEQQVAFGDASRQFQASSPMPAWGSQPPPALPQPATQPAPSQPQAGGPGPSADPASTERQTRRVKSGAIPKTRGDQMQVEDLEAPSDSPAPDAGVAAVTEGLRGLSTGAALRPGRSLATSDREPIRRPDKGGVLGMRVKVYTNHFEFRFNSQINVYHYDVEIEPQGGLGKLSIDSKRVIFRQFMKDMSSAQIPDEKKNCYVFDGQKNIYSTEPFPGLPREGHTFQFSFLDEERQRNKDVKIKIQFATQVDLSLLETYVQQQHNIERPQQALNVLNTAFKYMCQGRGDFVTLKRATFQKPSRANPPIDLGGGLDLWFGYQPSIIIGQWKVLLQVDISSKGFLKEVPVIEFANDFLYDQGLYNEYFNQNTRLDGRAIDALKKALAGYKVKTTHTNFTKKVVDFHRDSNFQLEDPEGGRKTIMQYFQEKYNITIKYPNLPCVRLHPKDKNILIPMELCVVKGEQPALKKLNEKQQSVMVKESAMDPSKRNQMIMKMLNIADVNRNPVFNAFNMQARDNQMMTVDARVLPGPDICGKDRESVMARDGKYDARNLTYTRPADLLNYVFLSPRFIQNLIGPLHSALRREAGFQGMQWPQNPLDVETFDDRQVHNLERAMNSVVQKHQRAIQQGGFLVVVLLGSSNADIYGAVKEFFDNGHQIPSQVLLKRTISGRSPNEPPNQMSIKQIMLKINSKLQGENVRSNENYLESSIKKSGAQMTPTLQSAVLAYKDIFRKPFMVFGADVTHPDPGDQGKPSIASVVGSLNSTLTKYGAQVRVQGSRVEIVSEMKEMFKNLLVQFNRQTKQKPETIFYYRDGVSEGQFSQVLIGELEAMQSACKELSPDGSYKPKITFIVVNKRHKARFFRDNDGRNTRNRDPIINILPGTVIDVDIVHPFQFDFYLCSHEGIKGTSRPAHYHVLYDDSGFGSDVLQGFTFTLCHLYARCTRAVSYPPPTYYAHHAAMRARFHVAHLTRNSDAYSSSGSSGSADPRLIESLNRRIQPASDKLLQKYPMYFI